MQPCGANHVNCAAMAITIITSYMAYSYRIAGKFGLQVYYFQTFDEKSLANE